MMAESLLVLAVALSIDRMFGDPNWLWTKLPHPVVLFGKAVAVADKRLNLENRSAVQRYRFGALAISVLIVLATIAGIILHSLFDRLGLLGWCIEIILVSILLAQKSLDDHVTAVASALADHGLSVGRKAVSMIVGRETASLDQSGVGRAAIESLAENFSDGVVAPAFWYAVLGLPGLLAYKMINTADSMIGYRNERYIWFGRVAAQIDDLANWIPARLSAFLIASGGYMLGGAKVFRNSLIIALSDAGLHASPNAGWPEAAMAGATNLILGGPRIYAGVLVPQARLNAAGRAVSGAVDIYFSLKIFKRACDVLLLLVIVACGFAAAL